MPQWKYSKEFIVPDFFLFLYNFSLLLYYTFQATKLQMFAIYYVICKCTMQKQNYSWELKPRWSFNILNSAPSERCWVWAIGLVLWSWRRRHLWSWNVFKITKDHQTSPGYSQPQDCLDDWEPSQKKISALIACKPVFWYWQYKCWHLYHFISAAVCWWNALGRQLERQFAECSPTTRPPAAQSILRNIMKALRRDVRRLGKKWMWAACDAPVRASDWIKMVFI